MSIIRDSWKYAEKKEFDVESKYKIDETLIRSTFYRALEGTVFKTR